MIRKTFFRVLVACIVLGTLAYGSSFGSIYDNGNDNSINANLLSSNYKQSTSLLEVSQSLVSLSNQLMSNPSDSNVAYINAMLRLSDDIGTMADKIGEMSDRIVATELQIGVMADRILETQKEQNRNIALTQANILKVQQNFQQTLMTFSSAR